MASSTKETSERKILLGYELTPRQDALVNYLIPSIGACVLYKFIIAADIAVIFRHYKDNDSIWAALTIFFLYLPALSSYMIIISDWDYYPEPDVGMTRSNGKWIFRQTLEHLCFPIWNMWRFAERIFWSIEALRAKDEKIISKYVGYVCLPRIIELYVFLQAYFHCLPQVILQLYILLRHNSDIARESKDSQVICIIFNLAKIAMTTTSYQRFKAQKLTGTQYPWLKKNKLLRSTSNRNRPLVQLRNSQGSHTRSIVQSKRISNISRFFKVEPPQIAERRRSSDIYLEPNEIVDIQRSSILKGNNSDSPDAIATTSDQSEPDFNIARVKYIKGLHEDDMAGKLIAFLWWFTFLLGRIMALSISSYFFMNACIWVCLVHIVVVLAFLVYDVKTDNIKRDKTMFFLFICYVYLFCIIEFKIKFKKAYFIYYGFFVLVFLENFALCIIWYNYEIDSLENDYWIRYGFYVTLGCTLLSLSAMIFYLTLTKPKSVSIPVTVININ